MNWDSAGSEPAFAPPGRAMRLPHQERSTDPLLGMLLDVRSVFDPESSLTVTLQEAVGDAGGCSAVAWVALPESDGGLVIERVLGQRTESLPQLHVGAGQGITGKVFERARMQWVQDYVGAESITHEFDSIIEDERLRRLIAAPLGDLIEHPGVLTVGRRDAGEFGGEMIARIADLANRAGAALEIARAARANAAAAALAERRRLSEDLHDGVGALLFSLASRTERLQRRVAEREFAEEIGALAGELGQIGSLVRTLVADWHSSATSDLYAEVEGIVEDFERRSEINAQAVLVGSLPPMNASVIQAMTRFIGVALSNVERHSQARRVTVTLSGLPDQVAAVVFNDGPAPASVIPGVGLGGAEERIIRLGGSLTDITEDDGAGFTVRARIPL
ncbi:MULTISPECIES: GAF domain-containing sensor histidine kinase [Nocardiaceae]|uniref:GAF domain-containing sensor histidine kinase n=1 Tax=Nocardiaceae TaxID=85025 RepID=UPI000B9BD0C6|nr:MULTISPECIES: GAF domain-containing protein [Rhodococcus]OZF51999.1 hypothetical protein CH291_05295 [Rhodococcus sp. 14-1411-2a]